MKRYLIFLPSTAFGVIALTVLWFRPFPYTTNPNVFIHISASLFVLALLLASAWLLEKASASFRYASKLLESALRGFRITVPLAFALALISSVAEELFFRGVIMPLLGVWGQAILFGLMHPAPKKAWHYTVFTGFAGLVFGFATLYTGSLYAAIFAHFVINLQGFLEIRKKSLAKKPTFS